MKSLRSPMFFCFYVGRISAFLAKIKYTFFLNRPPFDCVYKTVRWEGHRCNNFFKWYFIYTVKFIVCLSVRTTFFFSVFYLLARSGDHKKN